MALLFVNDSVDSEETIKWKHFLFCIDYTWKKWGICICCTIKELLMIHNLLQSTFQWQYHSRICCEVKMGTCTDSQVCFLLFWRIVGQKCA
jgi:hypothetical protein